jgi:hypothetical protein
MHWSAPTGFRVAEARVMEWFWAAISVCWTIGAWVIARTAWAMARHWGQAGVVDRGMGRGLSREDNPVGFALAYRGTQFVALLGLVFVAVGIAITLGWISRAL